MAPDINVRLSYIFKEIALSLEYQGENHFVVQSYNKFSNLLLALNEPINEIAVRGELEYLQGVGEKIGKKVTMWLETGSFFLYDRVRSEVPEPIRNLLLSGLSPKAVKYLHSKWHFQDIYSLKSQLSQVDIDALGGTSPKVKEEIKLWLQTS